MPNSNSSGAPTKREVPSIHGTFRTANTGKGHQNLQALAEQRQAIWQPLASGQFSFLDLGCGTGRSIAFGERMFGKGPGLGVDRSQEKISIAQRDGFTAICADITQIAAPAKCVSFCSMIHFLEHLKSLETAHAVLALAAEFARDFLFIRHPSFEHIDYLAGLGLKLAWTHWSGHRNMMRLDDFRDFFAEMGWTDYDILPRGAIQDASNAAIVPLRAPIDTVRYDPSGHGRKPHITFDLPVWSEFDLLIRINPRMRDSDWHHLVSSLHKMSDDPCRDQLTNGKPTRRGKIVTFGAKSRQRLLQRLARIWRGRRSSSDE